MTPMDTVAEALNRLQASGLPRLEAQMLVLQACQRPSEDRAWLLTHDQQVLTATEHEQLRAWAARRLAGEPMAYILGQKNFHALQLDIDARVLDPRDDTETLVDWALRLLPAEAPAEVLDLGTGSGAIALALAHARPKWRITATDVSDDALALAQHNAARLGLSVQWVLGDWLAPLVGRQFDMIVSNPPYIATNDPHLTALRHEPLHALVSGSDGLSAIRAIVQGASLHLKPQAWLLLEHGHRQAEAVRGLLGRAGFSEVVSERDLAGIERCSAGQWLPANFAHP
ncbi:MAG: peptide chain release factor N(5)-glutamine methyltransferase [Pseudomonadota bacterium]|jgi:release factor glutamine methyltransferase